MVYHTGDEVTHTPPGRISESIFFKTGVARAPHENGGFGENIVAISSTNASLGDFFPSPPRHRNKNIFEIWPTGVSRGAIRTHIVTSSHINIADICDGAGTSPAQQHFQS